jgi:branched-subunit amino acid ABC-type transport system permease component
VDVVLMTWALGLALAAVAAVVTALFLAPEEL